MMKKRNVRREKISLFKEILLSQHVEKVKRFIIEF